jgi:hypothetical protein
MNTYKNFKKYILVAIAATFAIMSCDKSVTTDNTPIQKTPTHNIDLKSINDGNRIFTDQQIKQVGQIHNIGVEYMIDSIEWSNSDIVNQMKSVFQDLTGNQAVFEHLNETSSDDYYREILKKYLSNEAYHLINNVAKNSINYNNVSNYSSYIETKKNYAKLNFNGVELDVILIALEVFQNSAYLWFDTYEGGLGLGSFMENNYLNNSNANLLSNSLKYEKFKAALEADGITAAASFIILAIEIAITASAGPWTTVAVNAALISIGLGSAFASVWAAVRQVELDKVIGPVNPLDNDSDTNKDIIALWKDKIAINIDKIFLPIIDVVKKYFYVSEISTK